MDWLSREDFDFRREMPKLAELAENQGASSVMQDVFDDAARFLRLASIAR